MQQARGVDLTNRADRLKSRDRLQDFFLGLQRLLQPQLTLEIGAHMATFSRRMARFGIEAHAFEANPYNHEAFSVSIRKRSPQVVYNQMAVSDIDGDVTFPIRVSRGGKALNKVAANNSLLPRSDDGNEYENVTVPSVRLETYLAKPSLKGRSFSAWIDVEGALGKVTAGFGSVLRNCQSLIVEVEEARYWQDQMLVLDAMRYFAGQGLVPVARDFESAHQYNLVYLRKDVLARPDVRLALARHLQDA